MKITVEVIESEFCDGESLLMDVCITHDYPEGSYTTLNVTARAVPAWYRGELDAVTVRAERLLSYEQDGELVAPPTMFCDLSTEVLVSEHPIVEAYAEKRFLEDYRAWALDRSV